MGPWKQVVAVEQLHEDLFFLSKTAFRLMEKQQRREWKLTNINMTGNLIH